MIDKLLLKHKLAKIKKHIAPVIAETLLRSRINRLAAEKEQAVQEAREETAREIFAEIESKMRGGYEGQFEHRLVLTKGVWESLKAKYLHPAPVSEPVMYICNKAHECCEEYCLLHKTPHVQRPSCRIRCEWHPGVCIPAPAPDKARIQEPRGNPQESEPTLYICDKAAECTSNLECHHQKWHVYESSCYSRCWNKGSKCVRVFPDKNRIQELKAEDIPENSGWVRENVREELKNLEGEK